MMPKLPEVKTDFYPMAGGLDLESPAIVIGPGKCFDACNYEPNTAGGYRRIDGFERYDGQASPTAASYWVITINQTGTVINGASVIGLTSGATGKVLGVYGTVLVLGRVTGAFAIGEALQTAGATVATAVTTSSVDGASRPSDHADYKLLAANDWRAGLLVVPGSGPIRGIWIYKDVAYAFRDNAAGTAGDMYKATAGGWVKVAFGQEIQFTAPVGEIKEAYFIYFLALH